MIEHEVAPPPIDDSVVIGFADALIGNTSLEQFKFGGYELSEAGRRALVNSLCDKSSLNNTFRSNHKLRIFSYYHYWRDVMENGIKDLDSLFSMNCR